MDEWLVFARLWLLRRALGETVGRTNGDGGDVAKRVAETSLLTQFVPLTTPLIFASDNFTSVMLFDVQSGIDSATEYKKEIEELTRLSVERDRLRAARRSLTRDIIRLRKELSCR